MDVEIDSWEVEVVDLFVGVFETLGLPKSTARIYGWLFCSDQPRSQEEICAALEMSAGSASQGLRMLHRLGAVIRHTPDGQRVSVYTAERSMRRLLGYFIEVQLRPGLSEGRERLEALLPDLPTEDAREKVQSLLRWQKKAEKALPVVSAVFGVHPGKESA